jgi:hypothetical protein
MSGGLAVSRISTATLNFEARSENERSIYREFVGLSRNLPSNPGRFTGVEVNSESIRTWGKLLDRLAQIDSALGSVVPAGT